MPRSLLQGSIQVFRLTLADKEPALEILKPYEDQEFCYVDATSFALMERLEISVFFAFTDIQFLAQSTPCVCV
jgi:predicted nucleic acid-binding protein